MIPVPLTIEQFDTTMQLVFALGGIAFGWAVARSIIDIATTVWAKR